MSCWRNTILTITSSHDTISFLQWNKLIIFYKEHKTELDEIERQMLLDKSEEYRLYLNVHTSSYIKHEDVDL